MQPPRSAGFSRLTSHTLTGWQHRLSVVQSRLKPALVRLRAHLNRRVKVPDLAITLGPVTESNCAGAIPPGGKQLELNEQSVTRLDTQRQVNSIRSAVLASLQAQRRSPNEIVRPALREWIASGREPQMVGDGMFGSSSDVNQGTTAGGERASRGQSPRSGMSGAASLRGWCDSSKTLSRVPEPVHQDHELESRMRENRLSGLGGGRRPKAVLYPHHSSMVSLLEQDAHPEFVPSK